MRLLPGRSLPAYAPAIVGLALVGRILFRRPWIIHAAAADGTVQMWQVIGLAGQPRRDRRDEIAKQLAASVTPPAS